MKIICWETTIFSGDDAMIEVKSLSKKYKKKEILNDISFTIPKGVYGLIGENGASKSTFSKILVALEQFENGNILSC